MTLWIVAFSFDISYFQWVDWSCLCIVAVVAVVDDDVAAAGVAVDVDVACATSACPFSACTCRICEYSRIRHCICSNGPCIWQTCSYLHSSSEFRAALLSDKTK